MLHHETILRISIERATKRYIFRANATLLYRLLKTYIITVLL